MKNKLLIDFGSKVKVKRKECALSQEELAELAGVHRTYIGMVERGEKNISLLNIYKISIAMNVDIRELF